MARELLCSSQEHSGTDLVWVGGGGPVCDQPQPTSELPSPLCSGLFPRLQHLRALEGWLGA